MQVFEQQCVIKTEEEPSPFSDDSSSVKEALEVAGESTNPNLREKCGKSLKATRSYPARTIPMLNIPGKGSKKLWVTKGFFRDVRS